jgi:hypothetical protein
MFRQEEHKHDYTRNPSTQTVRIGNDRVVIDYDEYICESCRYSISIITNIKIEKDYYRWV